MTSPEVTGGERKEGICVIVKPREREKKIFLFGGNDGDGDDGEVKSDQGSNRQVWTISTPAVLLTHSATHGDAPPISLPLLLFFPKLAINTRTDKPMPLVCHFLVNGTTRTRQSNKPDW